MANYDHDVLGVGNPMHPANQEPQELSYEDVLGNLSSYERLIVENFVWNLEAEIFELKQRIEVLRDKINRV
jgi:hypothetical protein